MACTTVWYRTDTHIYERALQDYLAAERQGSYTLITAITNILHTTNHSIDGGENRVGD